MKRRLRAKVRVTDRFLAQTLDGQLLYQGLFNSKCVDMNYFQHFSQEIRNQIWNLLEILQVSHHTEQDPSLQYNVMIILSKALNVLLLHLSADGKFWPPQCKTGLQTWGGNNCLLFCPPDTHACNSHWWKKIITHENNAAFDLHVFCSLCPSGGFVSSTSLLIPQHFTDSKPEAICLSNLKIKQFILLNADWQIIILGESEEGCLCAGLDLAYVC